jgi:hypothetical protein
MRWTTARATEKGRRASVTFPSDSETKKMKRKGSVIVDVVTKHFKAEPFVIANVYIMREISKSLTGAECCALMTTSSHHYQLLKPDREQHFLHFVDACKPKYAVAHLYRAVKDGFVTRENFKCWLEDKKLDLAVLGFSYVRQRIYDEPGAAPIPRAGHAYTYMLRDKKPGVLDIFFVMESMWKMRMHEDDMAELAIKMVALDPKTYVLDLMLNAMAITECSPKLLLDVKERTSKLALAQSDFSYNTRSCARPCPSVTYLIATQEVVPNLALFILTNGGCSQMHRSIVSDPQLLAYFAQRHRAKTTRILQYVNTPIPDTFLYTKKEIADLLIHKPRFAPKSGAVHLWNYVSDFYTPELTKALLAGNYDVRAIKLPHLWNHLALNGSKRDSVTNQDEPAYYHSLVALLRPHVNDVDFVKCFLRCFAGLDYRSLVIGLYPFSETPRELLQLQVPVTKYHPQIVLYYETLRLKAKYE